MEGSNLVAVNFVQTAFVVGREVGRNANLRMSRRFRFRTD